MPTVSETLHRPDDQPVRYAAVRIELAGEHGDPVVGYLEDETVVVALFRPAVVDGTWSTDQLTPNSLIIPAGTVYRIRTAVVGQPESAPRYISVPDDDGDYTVEDLLTDPPETLEDAALEAERQARIDGDNDLQAALDAVEASDVDSVNGRTGVVIGLAEQEDLDAEVAAREALAADLADEVANRTDADATIAADLATEISDRLAGDTANADDLATEAALARSNETDLSNAIAAEATTARNADNLTSGTVADARIASTIARDSEVAALIAQEVTDRNTAIANAVTGLADYRGTYDASANTFPATGGSGAAGAVAKADFWVASVAGTLGGTAVTPGDLIIAKADAPGQTAGSWDLVSHEIGYAPEDSANKDTDGTFAANSDTKYPSQKAAKTYVDAAKAAAIAASDPAGSADSAKAYAIQRGNHTGTQTADTITDGTTNKAYTAGEKTKLAGVATGATANDTDANLKARANHTGTQPLSTISDAGSAASHNAGVASASDLPTRADADARYAGASEATTARDAELALQDGLDQFLRANCS